MYATLADRKMHLLFELWDKDGDRHVSFAELALGLRKLSSAQESLADTASDAAEVFPVLSVKHRIFPCVLFSYGVVGNLLPSVSLLLFRNELASCNERNTKDARQPCLGKVHSDQSNLKNPSKRG